MMKHAIAFLALGLAPVCITSAEIPHLREQGATKQLIVKGEPFLMLGGELGNSSGESGYLAPYWDKMVSMNINTLVVPVSWFLVEPVEGQYDWNTLDGLIRDARANDMRLVVIWFGVWKNSMSCYAPDWVKTDTARFPRCLASNGRPVEIVTPLSEEALRCDARAFAAMMQHIKATDGEENTVVMVQVENEIGMVGDARDHSPLANAAYDSAVPAELITYMDKHFDSLHPTLRAKWLENGRKMSGKWAEVFGSDVQAEEIFMAWQFAQYTGKVTEAGKAEYPLPMYTNAALIRPGYVQGQYPSAGPLPHLIDVWRAAAPSLDFLSPDIYFKDFIYWADAYTVPGNPLFIPENMANTDAAVNAIYAIGNNHAMGYCPFAIESVSPQVEGLLRSSYGMLEQLSPLINAKAGTPDMVGCMPQGDEQKQPKNLFIKDLSLFVNFERVLPSANTIVIGADGTESKGSQGTIPSGAIIIATGPDELVIAGIGAVVTFAPRKAGPEIIGILSAEEGTYDEDGNWIHLRWLSGDQTHQGRHIRLDAGRFSIQRVRLYRYQ